MPKLRLARLAAVVAALGAVAVAGQASWSGSNGYVVQSGDTLWAIAQRSGVSVQALASANHMQLTDILSIGRHLVIPGRTATLTAAAIPAATPVAGARPASSAAGGTFCSTFRPTTASWGVLPALLRQSPSRLALRPLFVEWGQHYGVSPALLEAISWQESGWQQGVVSVDGAVGVGQLLPSTASFVSTNLIGVPLSIASTSDNIRMMARFVAYLEHEVSGTCQTIAAYYQGVQNLDAYGVLRISQQYVADVEYLIPAFS